MGEWQPIETAPIDQIVIVRGGGGGPPKRAFLDKLGNWRRERNRRPLLRPKEWMPLPEPPK